MSEKVEKADERYEYFLSLNNSEGKPLSSVVIHPVLWCCGNFDSWKPCVTKRDRYTQLKSVFRTMRTPPELRINQSEIDNHLTDVKLERCENHRSVDECIKQDVLTFCLQHQKALLNEDGKLKNPRIKAAFRGKALKVITARYKQGSSKTLIEQEFEYDFGVKIPETLSRCHTIYTSGDQKIKDIKSKISSTAEHQQKIKEHKCEPLMFPDGEDQKPGNELLIQLSARLSADKNLLNLLTKVDTNLPSQITHDGRKKEIERTNSLTRDSVKSTDSKKKDEQEILTHPQPRK